MLHILILALTLVVMTICAATDVMYRRTSETLVLGGTAVLAMMHWNWWFLVAGALVALPSFIAVLFKKAGLGDLEMSLLLGVAFGLFGGLISMWIGFFLATVTCPLWPRLATSKTPEGERKLNPLGLFYAIGALVWVLIGHWLTSYLTAFALALHGAIL